MIKKRKDLLLLKFLVIFAGKIYDLSQKFPVKMIIPRQNYVDMLAAGRGNGLVKIVTGALSSFSERAGHTGRPYHRIVFRRLEKQCAERPYEAVGLYRPPHYK